MAERTSDRAVPVDLVDDAVLWYINRVAFHPRGFALGCIRDVDGNNPQFVLLGNGREVWTMGDTDEDERFATFEAALERQRGAEEGRGLEVPPGTGAPAAG